MPLNDSLPPTREEVKANLARQILVELETAIFRPGVTVKLEIAEDLLGLSLQKMANKMAEDTMGILEKKYK